MAESSPPGGPLDRAGPGISKPCYPKPNAERLSFAESKLTEIEQYIAPNSAVLASLLIRALLPSKCTTAEAMWAVYKQIEAGRFTAYSLQNRPNSSSCIVSEDNPPAGLELPDGVLHLDADGSEWSMCVLRLPKPDHADDDRTEIDPTPTFPKPPPALIQLAERAIPEIMANVQPKHDGSIELIASHLAKRLQEAKHSLAAAHWAIHEAVRAGRLRTGQVGMEQPSFLPRGSTEWQGGAHGFIAVPIGKPTPFDSFTVTATEGLWTWWRSLETVDSRKSEPQAQTKFVENPPVIADRPSPFTIPEPTLRFTEGPPAAPIPPRSMTVGNLIHNLTQFASFYERASTDIERGEPMMKPLHVGNRDANAHYMQREFEATADIGRVRAYALGKYGADLTIGTARRLLGDLIRFTAVQVDVAEAMTLEEAMDRLEATPKKAPIPVTPLPSIVRNWLVAHYLADPTPANWPLSNGSAPEPLVLVRYESFAEFLLNAGLDLLPNLDQWKSAGWIEDIYVEISQSSDGNSSLLSCVARLNLPLGRHRLVGIRKAILDVTRLEETRADSGSENTSLTETASELVNAPRQASTRSPDEHIAATQNSQPTLALLNVFTNGISDDRIKQAAQWLTNDKLSAHEKLTKIDALICLPSTASAEQLGVLVGVSKQAVLKTEWWIQHRKGEKNNEIGRRRTGHQKRAESYEKPDVQDNDDIR